MRRVLFKNSSGFTLIEILVSMVLLAAIGVISLSSFANSTRMTIGKQNTAANLARATLEDLKNAVRSDWWGVGGNALSPIAATPQAPIVLDGVTFTPTLTILNVDPTATRTSIDVDQNGVVDDDEPRLVTISVNWTEPV